MEVLVVLVHKVGGVLLVLVEGLNHIPREELAVGLLDAPVQLADQLSGLGAVEEVHLRGVEMRTIFGYSTDQGLEVAHFVAISYEHA